MKTLIIDNYDSFTYNLFQLIAEVNGEEPTVIKNNEINWEQFQRLDFDNIVISPGPGHPDNPKDFGICRKVILEAKQPILGVCLGHQGIYSAFGGKVVHAPTPMHGRLSKIYHHDQELFCDIPAEFEVVRYHSLVGDKKSLPSCLAVTASTADDLIMAIRHKARPLWGVQFHPESICTTYGYQLLKNFRTLTEKYSPVIPKQDKKFFAFDNTNANKVNNIYHVKVKEIANYREPQEVFEYYYRDKINSVWLDSSKVIKGFSRYSFMGCPEGPLSYSVAYNTEKKQVTIRKQNEEVKKNLSIFDFLQEELKTYGVSTPDLPFNFNCGFIGYLGYELKSETNPVQNRHHSNLPDANFVFLDRVMVFDHLEKKCYLLALTDVDNEASAETWLKCTEAKILQIPNEGASYKPLPAPVSSAIFSRNRNTYINDIGKCLNYIKDGESYEICLTNKIKFNCSVNPYHYYASLREINPAPYAAFLNFDGFAVASSSMERYLHINTQGTVETKPIKGTLPRSQFPEKDRKLIAELEKNEKFRSENLMIVDLLRNDIGTVCEIGSVYVPYLMKVETYQTVHQLVSTIRGKLKPELNAIDCIKATFPGGSMTGAPKIRTMEIIDKLENEARGVYSGTIGYLAVNGTADLNIVIRTAIITSDEVSIGVGGAIINLSNPEEEYNEILLKANALERALENCTKPLERENA